MRAALCLFLLLALVGCRESLLTPEDELVNETEEAADESLADVRRGYLKGPGYVAVGEEGTFKAAPDSSVFFYKWTQRGEGAFRVFTTRERIVDFPAWRAGEVLVEYVAYSREGEPVLRGNLLVDVLE
ncbi:MAG: hypothetical protein AAF089_07630 [Bacteroidota bacterium]